MKWLIGLAAIVSLAGCSASNPEAGTAITYHLPRTDVKVTMGIDVTCAATGATIEPSFKADLMPGAQSKTYIVRGSDLVSASAKRNLVIKVDENRVLSSINATATDKRAAILGNVLKLAATAAAFGADGGPQWALTCTPKAMLAAAQAKSLRTRLDTLRSGLAADPKPEATLQKINLLASQIGVIADGLHRDISETVVLDAGWSHSQEISFNLAPLDDLLQFTSVGAAGGQTVAFSKRPDLTDMKVQGHYEELPATSFTGAVTPPAPDSRWEKCDQTIIVPSPKYVSFVVEPQGGRVMGEPKTGTTRVTWVVLPAAQLNTEAAKICISAKFGEDRTVGLSFNKFGEVTEFTWDADSQAANVSGALADTADKASTIADGIRGAGQRADKAELEELQTQQALRKARACQAAIDAGASGCD